MGVENGNGGLLQALVAVQAEIQTVRKGETAEVQTKTGGKYTYQYADLADIVEDATPIMVKHDLAFSAKLVSGPALHYRLGHAPSGETDEDSFDLAPFLPERATMQDLGGVVTYARRYILCALLNIAPKGDDTDAKDIPGRGTDTRTTGGGYYPSEQPSDKQLSFLTFQVTKAKNDGLKTKNLRTMLDRVGASDVEIREGWIQSLTKGQVSGLLDIFKQGTLPTGDSDLPSDVPAPPVVEPGDDIPFPTADEGKELRETTGA